MDNSTFFNANGGRVCELASSPLFSLVRKKQSSAQHVIVLCLGRFQKSRPLLVLVWIFALLQNSQMASLAFFALLPPATASQILGTFEKFPESLPDKSAQLSANRGAPGIPTRWACVPPSPDFRPSALSFDLEFQLIGLRLCFSV